VEPLYTTQSIPKLLDNLILTSPPFALQHKKEYFTLEAKQIIKNTGSFVMEPGVAYCKGKPIRLRHNYRVLLRMCDGQGWNLAAEFLQFNKACGIPHPLQGGDG